MSSVYVGCFIPKFPICLMLGDSYAIPDLAQYKYLRIFYLSANFDPINGFYHISRCLNTRFP